VVGVLACLACCAVPALLAAGILTGAGWAVAGRWLPAVAVGRLVAALARWDPLAAPWMPSRRELPRVRAGARPPHHATDFLG
jgi:hypothetical protein